MKHFQSNSYKIGKGISYVHVTLEDAMPDSDYLLYVQMINVLDANPKLFCTTIIAKYNTHFVVELSGLTDSDKYHVAFLAFYKDDVDNIPVHMIKGTGSLDTEAIRKAWNDNIDHSKPFRTPIIGDQKALCTGHKWKRYQGLMESYDYCEYCDEKRKQ